MPPAFRWFRAYCLLMSLVYVGVVAGGVWVALYSLERPNMGPAAAAFMGGIPILVGLVLVVAYAALPFLPRKPWAWTAGLVALIIGSIGACPPLAIPLLIFWLKPEMKAAFGRPAPIPAD